MHAAQANVLAPNKHSAAAEAMWKGHLLDSETYIGGKVEALESGIFRSDLPTRFKLQPAAYQVGVTFGCTCKPDTVGVVDPQLSRYPGQPQCCLHGIMFSCIVFPRANVPMGFESAHAS
jgi:hypothetical protein